MKILICGKGGSGKSTIVVLLAKEMAFLQLALLGILHLSGQRGSPLLKVPALAEPSM